MTILCLNRLKKTFYFKCHFHILGGLQVGGGITDENAKYWLDSGASKVIVTSWLFPEAKFSLSRLQILSNMIGKDNLVVDLRFFLLNFFWNK